MYRYVIWLLPAFIFILASWALPATGDLTPAEKPALKVILATPQSGVWTITDDRSHLDVILVNTGAKPISIYDMWNSWGWNNIKLQWTIGDQKGTVVHAPRQWERNVPTTTEIPLWGATVQQVDLGTDWQGWPKDMNGKEITVQVIYESKEPYPAGVAGKPGWQGAVVSNPVTIKVVDQRPHAQ